MDRDEYRAALRAMHLSQTRAARWMGISVRTSQGYALGERRLPASAAAKAQTYSGNDLSTHCATDMPFVAGYIAGFK
jgi:hypothetical protein